MLVQAEPLTKAVARIFEGAGSNEAEAGCVARHLVDSNLCGHDSHGVIRVGRYVGFVKAGTLMPNVTPKVVVETPVSAVVDGGMGYGQVVGEFAMNLLGRKAKAATLGLVSIRNCGHLGRTGDWAEQLGAQGLISLHFMNTTGLGMMAVPFGGTDRRLSLNPVAICVPIPGRRSVLVDFTTSTVAEGKLAVARNKGEPVPLGTIVDSRGRPTTDPNDFYAGGALLPIAGHKGHGLNIAIDLLAGALSGGGCTRPGVTVMANTMTSIAIDPTPLVDAGAYVEEMIRYCDWVTGSPPAEPDAKVMLPGEVEHATRARRRREGVPLDDTTWGQITAAGESVGVTAAEIARLAGV